MSDPSELGAISTAEFVSPALRLQLERCTDLPALPGIAARLLELCRQDDLDLKQVADTLSGDQALVSIILRLVNSTAFGLRQQVRSTSHAIAFLGLNAVRTLTLSCSLAGEIVGPHRSELGTVWKRSVVAAVAAREVALTVRFAAPDEAFLAALLQDIGMQVLDRLPGIDYASELVRAGGDPRRLRAAERALCGADHAEVGGWLLGTWNLPGPLCLAVAASEDGGPDLALPRLPDDVRQLVQIVRLSSVVADVWVDADASRAVAEARRHARARLGIDEGVMEGILTRTAVSIPGVASLFGLSLGAAEDLAAALDLIVATAGPVSPHPNRHVDWAHAAAETPGLVD